VSLTAADVVHLAELARIELTEAELEKLPGQIEGILAAVAVVSSVGDDVLATSHALSLSNVFRADEPRPSLAPEAALAMAPAGQDGRFRVPRILEED